MSRYDALCAELRAEFPRFRVVKKSDSRFHRAIHWSLVVLTFGGMRAYLTDYVTTIGQGVYVSSDWDLRSDDDRWSTLRHEAVHLRQFRRYTLPGMAFLYLLIPLPLGVAWFRARFEQEAYAETIRCAAEKHGLAHVRSGYFRQHILEQFTGAAYGWMWPFKKSLDRWYDGVVASLERS
jgi:hypothetical protein